MKSVFQLLLVAFTILSAQAQSNSFSLDVIGYVNYRFQSGENLFHNNLSNPWSSSNTLNTVFEPAATPIGATVSLWNPALNTYDTPSTYLGGGVWTINFNLFPGTGAKLNAPNAFTNTLVGLVLDHDGSPFGGTWHDPAPFAGPAGVYLLGDKAPLTSVGNDIFMHVLGRAPNVGEQFVGSPGTELEFAL